MSELTKADFDAIHRHLDRHRKAMEADHYGTMPVAEPDKTCLSWWFPRLVEAKLPVPETRYIALGHRIGIMDGVFDESPNDHAFALASMLNAFASEKRIGFPCFLRTGHFSGKHNWHQTCHVPYAEAMIGHIHALADMQEIVGAVGTNPYSVWAVRKMLPTKPVVRLTKYGNFPLTREIRVFVDYDRIAYSQPYWPEEAIANGVPQHDAWSLGDVQGFAEGEKREIYSLASRAGAACGGRWAVDILDTRDGWFITDMAEAERSYGFDPARYGLEPVED